MVQEENFRPINLFDTRVITTPRYVVGEVENYKNQTEKLGLCFKVIKGQSTGFKMYTEFPFTRRGIARLSHLCKAVGIVGKLNDPRELLGKKLKLRVVPEYKHRQGRTYLEHRITRFHPLDSRFR